MRFNLTTIEQQTALTERLARRLRLHADHLSKERASLDRRLERISQILQQKAITAK